MQLYATKVAAGMDISYAWHKGTGRLSSWASPLEDFFYHTSALYLGEARVESLRGMVRVWKGIELDPSVLSILNTNKLQFHDLDNVVKFFRILQNYDKYNWILQGL